MNTRRYPRTLEQAFGPYTSREFHEPMHWADKVVTVASAIACVALVAIMVVGAV